MVTRGFKRGGVCKNLLAPLVWGSLGGSTLTRLPHCGRSQSLSLLSVAEDGATENALTVQCPGSALRALVCELCLPPRCEVGAAATPRDRLETAPWLPDGGDVLNRPGAQPRAQPRARVCSSAASGGSCRLCVFACGPPACVVSLRSFKLWSWKVYLEILSCINSFCQIMLSYRCYTHFSNYTNSNQANIKL